MRQLIALILILIHTPGWAQTFYNNYSQWKSLNQSQKMGYVSGAMDRHLGLGSQDEEPYVLAEKSGVGRCLTDLEITNTMLAEAVTKHYENNLGHWDTLPAIVLSGVVQSICLKFINNSRIQYGLSPPWKKWEGY